LKSCGGLGFFFPDSRAWYFNCQRQFSIFAVSSVKSYQVYIHLWKTVLAEATIKLVETGTEPRK